MYIYIYIYIYIIEGIEEKTIIISCAQEDACFITNQRQLKKKHKGHTNKMNWDYLENYVWIPARGNDLGQGIVLWGI